MVRLRQSIPRQAFDDPAFLLFLAAVVLSLIRAANQPGIDLQAIGTSLTVVPGDVVLATLTLVVVVRLVRGRRYPRQAVAVTACAGAFALLIVGTAAANGATALVAGSKLVELAALLVGAVVLVDRVERLWAVIVVVVAVNCAAAVWAVVGFAEHPGDRQASFLGEHDLAALSTMSLAVGLAAQYCPHRLGRLPLVAGIAGAAGITLGASLASLLGLYAAALAFMAVATVRGGLRFRPVAVTALIALALTAGTYVVRGSDLGFLRAWFAPAPNAQPGDYAGSWSQRLIFTYIGGRIFIAHPVLGTGWWGELPPKEYVRFLPAARARFSDQPSWYFPPEKGSFIPQQAYDQVLYELGAIGIAVLLALGISAVRNASQAARDWPRGETDAIVSFLPAGWLASLAGALAGAALFGGTPLAALFWLTLGLVAALTALASEERGCSTAAAVRQRARAVPS